MCGCHGGDYRMKEGDLTMLHAISFPIVTIEID